MHRAVSPWRFDQDKSTIAEDKFPSEELLVDAPERTHRQVLIVDALPSNAVKPVQCWGKRNVRNRTSFKPRMAVGIKQATVVLSDIETRVALVNCTKECLQLGEQRVIRPRQAALIVDKAEKVESLLRRGIPPIVWVIDRQKSSRLCKQAKEQSVEEDECICEGGIEGLASRLVVTEQPCGDRRDGSEHGLLQGIRYSN